MVRPNGSTEAAPKIKEPLIKSLLVILLMGFTPTFVITGAGSLQGRLMNVKTITPDGRRVVSGSEDKMLRGCLGFSNRSLQSLPLRRQGELFFCG